MKKTLFLVLCIFIIQDTAQGAVEIYANGHKYTSIHDYLGSKKAPVTPSLHRLYVLSVEHGVVEALTGFDQQTGESGSPVARSITSEQLQGIIQQAVTASGSPKLLIAQPGKLRILDLAQADPKQAPQ